MNYLEGYARARMTIDRIERTQPGPDPDRRRKVDPRRLKQWLMGHIPTRRPVLVTGQRAPLEN